MRHGKTFVAGAFALGLVAGGLGVANASDRTDRRTEAFSLYAVPDPAGDAFLPADPSAAPPDGEEAPPMVGDEFTFTDVVHALDTEAGEPAPAGGPIGVNNGRCMVAEVFADEFDAAVACTGVIALDGRGSLAWQTRFRFSEFGDPGHIAVALTGGTGDFYGAGGQVSVRELPTDDADEDTAPPSVYDVELLDLAQAASSD